MTDLSVSPSRRCEAVVEVDLSVERIDSDNISRPTRRGEGLVPLPVPCYEYALEDDDWRVDGLSYPFLY